MRKNIIEFGMIGLSVFLSASAYALDLGDQPAAQSQVNANGSQQESEVEVTNFPLQFVTKKIDNEEREIPYMRVMTSDYFILEIGKDISLSNGESYTSDVFDVREYKEVSFYVIPDQVLGEQMPAVYQLDAFFSVTASTQKTQKMGEKAGAGINGWQEFGDMKIDEEAEKPLSTFHKLTTGVTSSRVLHTKIYGPFVQVVLKNLSPDSKRRFKIAAYLSR